MTHSSCPICYAPATKYNHYGGTSCTSCRSFFRRSVDSQQYLFFRCLLTSDDSQGDQPLCHINSKSRISCKRCRFQKCLNNGMKVGFVSSHFERIDKMIQKSEKLQKLMAARSGGAFKPLTHLWSPDDSALAIRKADEMFDLSLGVYCDLGVISHMYQFFDMGLRGKCPSYETVKALEQLDSKIVTTVAFKGYLGPFQLSEEAMGILVGHNLSKILGLLWLVSPDDIEMFFFSLLRYAKQHDVRPVVEVLEFLMRRDASDFRFKSLYEGLYASPWAASLEIEQQHLLLYNQLSSYVLTDPQGCGKSDKVFQYIMSMILILSTDGLTHQPRLSAAERSKIEALQLHFVSMMDRYLKFKRASRSGLHAKQLADVVMLIQTTQELWALHSRRLPI